MLENIIYIGFFFGILGTFIGGIIGVCVRFKSTRTLSCILEFAAGLMMSVVAFDLLPESFEFGGNYVTIVFFVIGVIVAILLENVINKFSKRHKVSGRTRGPCRGRPRVDPKIDPRSAYDWYLGWNWSSPT